VIASTGCVVSVPRYNRLNWLITTLERPFADVPMHNLFHYTDVDGWNGIRSQPVWRFKASKPKDPARPVGAYFTDIEPTATNLRTLHKKIRVPKVKQAYVFWFLGTDGLSQLNGGRGRDRRIFFSPVDYNVMKDRQRRECPTDELLETFS
jgi:hypothetical protein